MNNKFTIEDIEKVRNREGFPVAKDEDIIELSNLPYYTACPNPYVEEFVRENGTAYKEESDNYHCEPYAADVSEGKTDPIYMAHTYHTKVPHRAIMKYIMHYTKPGDLVFDGFCGTGMTGLAAISCGEQHGLFSLNKDEHIGARNAIISDLSPAATFIAHNYTNSINVHEFNMEVGTILDKCAKEYGWMYETKHSDGGVGTINYVVWSDVFICPTCGEEFVFWDVAIGDDKEVKNPFYCPNCKSELKKSSCERAQELKYKALDRSVYNQAKQVPVMINYVYRGKKYEKTPDEADLNTIERIKDLVTKFDIPTDELPDGDNTAQPVQSHNFRYVNQFYYDRSAIVFAFVLNEAKKAKNKDTITFLVTSILTKTGSKLHNIGFKNGKLNLAGAMPNVLYVPSTVAERNIIELLSSKLKDINKIYDEDRSAGKVLVQTCSATDTGIPNNSIDYIFTDPPFGANINYSEMNYIWESWLRVKTNISQEAIMNRTQKKGLYDYQELMEGAFRECFRVLKPGRWMTVEFHNSLNSVWNAIQEAIQKAGFVVADVRTLDKKQGTFKQMTSNSAVKQDLVISAYKPQDGFIKDFEMKAGTEQSAWAFISQHLSKLPVVVDADNDGRIDIIAERQAFLLFDRMVAYHIMNGMPIPIDASDFYKGLDEKYIKRDTMYFLADQVNEYDTARTKMDVEPVQLSFVVTNEKTAIGWLYQQLDTPQTYADIQPKFMKEVKAVDKYEAIPELAVILEENFLQDDKGRWYIPDVTKQGDVAKLREKKLVKEFEGYMQSKGKLKLFRSEAIRAGFSMLWKDKNYQAIVDMAQRLPEATIQEDQNLLMYYDISLSRI